MRFYLGTDMPGWLWAQHEAAWPLFVSHRRLDKYRTLKPATADWALDSGGFTELSMHGEWRTTPGEYVAAIRRYRDEIGRLQWAAPQDWMCEPFMVDKTGLSVAEHQRRTVENYLTLRELAPDLPIVPVLQGWSATDYWRHVDAYTDAGVDLAAEQTVGLGSVCRRNAYDEVIALVVQLHDAGIRLHGFGLKQAGISRYGWALHSADSMAWSFTGRMAPGRLCGRVHKSPRCAHCRTWAEMWAERATADRGQAVQLTLAVPS